MGGDLRSRPTVSFHFLVDTDFYKYTVASVISQFVRTSPEFNSQQKALVSNTGLVVPSSDALGGGAIRQWLIFYSQYGKSLGSGEIIGRTPIGVTIID